MSLRSKHVLVRVYGLRCAKVHKRGKKGVQHPAILTEQAWSVKILMIYGKRTLFSCGTQQIILSRQDSANLPAQVHVANHSTGFGSSSPLTGLAIQG